VTDPAPRDVGLGVGEETELATFTSSAVGDPAPARQWQSKRPGTSRFTDLEGETGETLTVDAEPGMDGTEYRAVYENAAGRIASEAATLGVDYAPRIVIDVLGTSVTEGGEAEFSVLSDGKPEPEISWQRRVGGFWQAIDPDDDNFEIDGPSLTVIETNTDQSGSLFRARLRNSLGTVHSRAASLTVSPKVAIPPGGIDLEDVSLEWTGNEEMQKAPPFGAGNYFSAGVSDGDEVSYRPVDGNAAVFQVSSSGSESLATWATRAAHVGSGGEQVARLYGGDARIEPDGSATVRWDGAFSVNFYGGLVPFTVADPELTVDASGGGELSADLSGYASSQANPNERSPLAPVADVTIATFSGIEIDPDGEIAIEPDYAGVEVDIPAPFAAQTRAGPGWGAWPQDFVDFHTQTGLAPYWYSSGSAFDPYKQPDPFVVDFYGDPAPAAPADDLRPPSGSAPGAGSGPQVRQPGAEAAEALIAVPVRAGAVGPGRIARLAILTCPGGGFCAVLAPRRAKVRIGAGAFWARVLAPKLLESGGTAPVSLKLSKKALRKLGRRGGSVRVPIALRSDLGTVRRVVVVKLKRTRKASRGKRGRDGGGKAPAGVGDVKAGPISAEPPLLARPASAVDVSGVSIAWHPRDSWLRYVSSGVGSGDGILLSNGAVGTNATSSPCPDRPSNSDAQLPYTVEFAPKASWYDPASGTAGIYGQGGVGFRWASHSIDLTASDPEIEINGSASRAIFRFSGSSGTAYPDQRAALVGLDLSGKPTVGADGRTFTYDLMRGRLTADGVNVFAGFYTPPTNDEFGCVSVSFTTP
jgi:Htaa